MGVPSSSLQRELKDLTSAGILKTQRQGRMVYYQANTESPVFPDLRGLLLKTAGLVDVLAGALKPLPADLALPLRRAREVLGREIKPTVYSSAEFDRRRATKDHFLT
jgi:DNA-binding transcriptional ArsR family regulator